MQRRELVSSLQYLFGIGCVNFDFLSLLDGSLDSSFELLIVFLFDFSFDRDQ